MRRRQFVATAGGTLAVSVAGCSQFDDVFDDGEEGTAADADDSGTWATFRGDAARTGRAPADAGPGDSLAVSWTLTVDDIIADIEDDDPDQGFPATSDHVSWPVIVDDLVLWTAGYGWGGGDNRRRAVRLLAADTATGTIEWTAELAADTDVDLSRWYAPAVDAGLVYVPDFVGGDLGIAVYDPADGERTAEFALGLPTVASEILAHEATIYLAATGETPRLYAFDASSGEERWSVTTVPQSRDSAFCSVIGDRLLYYDRLNGIVAVDTDSGDELWRRQLELPRSFVSGAVTLAPPTGGEDGVYAAGSLDAMTQLDVSPLVGFDPATGDELFQYDPPGIPTADSKFATVNPNLSAAELEALPPFSAVYGLPVVTEELVVATGYGDPAGGSGQSHCFAVDHDGSLSWTLETGVAFAPVLAGEVIYLVSTNGVEAISTEGEYLDAVMQEDDGRGEGETVSPRPTSTPAIGDDRLYVPTRTGLVAVE